MSCEQKSCFHCGLPLPLGRLSTLPLLEADRAFCCPGCLAVYRTIVDSGLEDYYRYRTAKVARTDQDATADMLKRLSLFDHPDVQRSFVRGEEGGIRQASLILDNVRCAACLWLNEQHLRQLDGVVDVQMDYGSQRAQVWWDPAQIKLSQILGAIAAIGYVAHPYDPSHRDQLLRDRKRRNANRLIFAGVIGMPVMQFSLATYVMGESVTGHLELWEIIGRWTTLAAVTGMLLYSAQDFFVGAWRDLTNRRLGMDVPIVLGLATAWFGSLVATVTQVGDVYVDSIAMFVFLVLLARIYEMRGRVASANAMDKLARVVPQTARRVREDGQEDEVPTVELKPGDRLRIPPGHALPADGVLIEGRSSFDEAMLTGEPLPVAKGVGDSVTAGTCNGEQPVMMEVTRVGQNSTAGEIRHLLARGLRSRPHYAVLAERVAAWFVAAVLLVAAATAGVWLWLSPEAALSNTIAVLIVTCPCALALATPVAVAVSTGRFADAGILPLRMSAMETLATATVAVFDKTGTLTRGELEVVHVEQVGALEETRVRQVIGALERHSEHPVGAALRRYAGQSDLGVEDLRHEPGAGIAATVNGDQWRLGKPAFALRGASAPRSIHSLIAALEDSGQLVVVLAQRGVAHAVIGLRDALRAGADMLVGELAAQGFEEFVLLSGDSEHNVTRMASALRIPEAQGNQSPSDKLVWLQRRQAAGARVLMVGDGINDAPTLAAADVSVSFAEATALAQYNSDFVILAKDLSALATAHRIARRTRRIIRQNLSWAIAYNLLAVPAAALGYIPPWAAAIGMSLSSLLVVANALRLRAGERRSERNPKVASMLPEAKALPS